MSLISISEFSLVVLIGAADTDRSAFAKKHFSNHEVLSLDAFVEWLGEGKEGAELREDAAEALAFVLEKRLKHRKLTVIDAENMSQPARKVFRLLSRKYHCPLVGLVFGYGSLSVQYLEESKHLKTEGFVETHRFHSPAEAQSVELKRLPLPSDLQSATGPFDVVGDLHGCLEELKALLADMAYEEANGKWGHAAGRRLVFVGDLVNKGPDSAGTLDLVMRLVEQGMAFCVPGNHDDKLLRKLKGQQVEEDAAFTECVAQIEKKGPEFTAAAVQFLEGLPAHVELSGGDLVVAHAGLKQEMHGRNSPDVRSFCLWGETGTEMDEFGLPVRFSWADEYLGKAMVVFGHAPVPSPIWQGNAVNIDTGCVYGGALTAIRFPERSIVSVAASKVHAEPRRPFALEEEESLQSDADNLVISRFAGRSLSSTRYNYHITLKEEYAPAVLELFSFNRIDPHWFIYLPPAYSPPKSSKLPGLLEHPLDAFNYYRKKGQEQAVIHDAGLGNRVVVVLCKDQESARNRFGVLDGSFGAVYDRFGQPTFAKVSEEQAFLARMREVVSEAELWGEMKTDWLCIEGEITPWNGGVGKAEIQFHENIAAAGAMDLERTLQVLEVAAQRGLDVDLLGRSMRMKQERLRKHAHMSRALYSGDSGFMMWHLLATEGKTYSDMPHSWHLGKLSSLSVSGFCQAPAHRLVQLDDEAQVHAAGQFWQSRTEGSLKGMVVKPSILLQEGGKDLIQPGLKVRGKEMLRGIYGPEYDDPKFLDVYRTRSLKDKRLMVIRQFALGWEGLNRFVEGQPFADVYESFFTGMSLNAFDLDQRI